MYGTTCLHVFTMITLNCEVVEHCCLVLTRILIKLDDIKILLNDWPYGFSENIVHLVIWTRFTLDSDPATGDTTERSRELIDLYVNHVFGDYVEAGKVLLTNLSFLHSAPADSG